MDNLIDKGKVADKISDLFLDNYPDPSKDLEAFYKEVLKIVVNAETQGDWISVKDRLPKREGPVMVTTENWGAVPIVFTALLWTTKDGSKPEWRDCDGVDIERMMCASVTHWMPLPPKPESIEVQHE